MPGAGGASPLLPNTPSSSQSLPEELGLSLSQFTSRMAPCPLGPQVQVLCGHQKRRGRLGTPSRSPERTSGPPKCRSSTFENGNSWRLGVAPVAHSALRLPPSAPPWPSSFAHYSPHVDSTSGVLLTGVKAWGGASEPESRPTCKCFPSAM